MKLLYALLCAIFPRKTYSVLKKRYANKTKEQQQQLLNMMPLNVVRFDLTSYFRSLHKKRK